jgi:recombination protein RecA
MFVVCSVSSRPVKSVKQMKIEELQRAISAIHVRFGGQALVRADRLPPVRPWPTGQPAIDRLAGIGGLPHGRVSVLQGAAGSGKLSLALALLARATREFALAIVIDPRRGLDPWTLDVLGADLATLTVVRPPNPLAAGEAAVALARAGLGFLLMLGEPPEPSLAPLESAAARSGCLVATVPDAPEAQRALAHASSLTLEMERRDWIWERGQPAGLWARLRCVKNKLAAPGAEAEIELRYALAPPQLPEEPIRERGVQDEVEDEVEDAVVELWPAQSAAG